MSAEQMSLVTVSAEYGAGGSVIAPALSRRLGVPCLQRATTSQGGIAGSQIAVEHLAPEEQNMTPAHRLLAALTQCAPVGPTQTPPPPYLAEQDLRQQGEAGIRQLADADGGVILGRGAAVVLGKGRGFHIRLYGPAELRVAQGAAIEGVSPEEARRRMRAADRARDAYVRRLYRADPSDPRHYHLMIDSTALPLDAVTEVILRALAVRPAPVPAQPRASAGQ